MTRPRRFLVRIIVFMVAVAMVAAALMTPISRAFMANPALNGLILGVLLIGIGYVLRQVAMLGAEITWLETYHHAQHSSAVAPPPPPLFLVGVAAALDNRGARGSLSAMASRTLLDSIGARLDESREISRYLIALLIFLGLLGTFWGLLDTMSSVGAAIKSLNVGGGAESAQMFEELKRGLESPLSGMATAFSSSLFGLSGSLVLGFLDLQAGQAQNRFFNELEEWLAGMTRFTAGATIGDGDQSVPTYIQALLENTADSLENLQRTISRAEENRGASNTAVQQLAERLAVLTDHMRGEQNLLTKLIEQQSELKSVLAHLATLSASGGLDEASRNHLRSLDLYVGRLLQESADGRNRMTEELRSEIKLLARTMAAIADERRKSS